MGRQSVYWACNFWVHCIVESGNLVYLKDFWRVDHPEVQKEGHVYRELQDAKVSNIAKMGRAGDVPMLPGDDKLEVVSSGIQRTKTQDYRSTCPHTQRALVLATKEANVSLEYALHQIKRGAAFTPKWISVCHAPGLIRLSLFA
jgi:hypothetical protein